EGITTEHSSQQRVFHQYRTFLRQSEFGLMTAPAAAPKISISKKFSYVSRITDGMLFMRKKRWVQL
ncbi:MAG: hypothetical protein ACXW39_04545, partial [Nitrospira sp.]